MIRFIVGLVIVLGSVGGIETATDAMLFPLVLIAGVGLALMYFGSEKIKEM
jgi:hypothetical protein